MTVTRKKGIQLHEVSGIYKVDDFTVFVVLHDLGGGNHQGNDSTGSCLRCRKLRHRPLIHHRYLPCRLLRRISRAKRPIENNQPRAEQCLPRGFGCYGTSPFRPEIHASRWSIDAERWRRPAATVFPSSAGASRPGLAVRDTISAPPPCKSECGAVPRRHDGLAWTSSRSPGKGWMGGFDPGYPAQGWR
jgi:hypothetical protein